jgi:uncharacterized protein (TIGR00297 family)
VSAPGAVLLAGLLALAGSVAGWLTLDGAFAATVVGGTIFTGAGLTGAFLLGSFFVTGSLLTYGARGSDRRPGRRGRTGRQVLANGGWAAVGAALIAARSVDVGWVILTGALAAAQGDTWATEIGSRAAHPPRLITTGRSVPTGTSGGITLLGSAAGVGGAVALAAIAWALGVARDVAAAAAAGGAAGLFVDSLIGATVQGRFRCDACEDVTESARHHCGAATRLVGGMRGVDNDVVNALGTAAGSGAALIIWVALHR